MIPQSPAAALTLLTLSIFLWGTWANTLKCSKAVRYEIYYWDFIFGALLTGTILGLTFGEYGYGYALDLFRHHFRYIIQAVISGVLFNIANLLLVAGVSMSGLCFAYFMCFSTTLITDSLMRYIIDTDGQKSSLFIGLLFLIFGVFFAIGSYKKLPHKSDVLRKVISITLFSGLMLGLFYPLLGKSLSIPDQYRLGPYAAFFFFSVGLFLCNIVLNWFLMRKPLFGHPLSYQDYRATTWENHSLGWAGGALWSIAMCFRLLAGRVASDALVFFGIQIVAIIAAVWGLCVWKEYAGQAKAKTMLFTAYGIYCVGVVLIGLAEFS